MTSSSIDNPASFADLGLNSALLNSLSELGYEKPSPIQSASIPFLLAGRDLLGQAQTGTGKTAAFALPLLTNLKIKNRQPQILVLTPTRELAIQVSEAFQRYARQMDINILPIYGGQSFSNQLKQLKRGAQIIVGTPGRVMDHIRRGTLDLGTLSTVVLDEADEMLRMGFIDDVEWILEHTPKERQTALFSATMPKEIKKVANTYLVEPAHIKIETKTSTASTINQRYTLINHRQKLEAFARILEIEDYDGVIVFVRTKIATVELADKLSARGYRAIALNGDIPQNQREQIVEKIKKGRHDILVATDVVARGLDIERISHVINYDIPLDTESYVHRIGRTGRAGRKGEAILFVTPRERHLLKAIERTTKSSIDSMTIPSADDINEKRMDKFKQQIGDTIKNVDLSFYQQLITEYQQEYESEPALIAAALAYITQGKKTLIEDNTDFEVKTRGDSKKKPRRKDREHGKNSRSNDQSRSQKKSKGNKDRQTMPDENMEQYRIDVGYDDGVKPGNIVGAIANEADLNSQYIGHIKIKDDHSFVDLPKGMPKATFNKLKKAYVCGKQMNLTLVNE
jgi:ATP-dependent RNA helicase DeaD